MAQVADLMRVARLLVRLHRRAEPALQRAVFYPDPQGREIRLLEVVKGSPDAGKIYAFRFAPDPARGVPYPLVLAELSPKEYRELRTARSGNGSQGLALPSGWENPVEIFAK